MREERPQGDRLRNTVSENPGRRVRMLPACGLLLLTILCTGSVAAQQNASDTEAVSTAELSEAVRALRQEVRELRGALAEVRSASEQNREETRALRQEVQELRTFAGGQKQLAVQNGAWVALKDGSGGVSPNAHYVNGGGSADESQAKGDQNYSHEADKKGGRDASLQEEYDLLGGKVDDQYQTKVESASKYRLRVSGIVLLNLFSNQGTVSNLDLPTLAYPRAAGDSGGSFGATLRQSEIGFEVFGPRVAGARTRADLQLDLAGGFLSEPNGINSGLMRLRTATMRMDWDNTSVIAGQDGIFFSPNSPTSFATLAEPALSYAGNLWGWVPQVRVEHRITLSERSSLLLQGGILDPLSGEVPGTSGYRQSGPGESSRQPAYGSRVAWTRDVFGQKLRLGMGGFYGRQNYGFRRTVDAWAWMSDLELPLGSRFELSGEVYRGRALGGLYGGFGQSVIFSSVDPTKPYTDVVGLNTVGGWTQLKYRAARKVELNWAFGMENPYARDLRYFPTPYSYLDPTLTRNRAGFGNVIYRPRSDLLFSVEYRRMETNSSVTGLSGAGHLNIAMGVLF